MGSKKIYFASDFHLGLDMNYQSSIERQEYILRWLDLVASDASELYLLGDIFDYWFEYRSGIPSGFEKFLGKIGELRNGGLPIYFFTGNHDLWMKSYFEEEYGIPVYHKPITKSFDSKKLYLGHGDGLGPGDTNYKLMKKIFTNPICQRAFSLIPSGIGLSMMRYFSKRSREKYTEPIAFLGEKKEALIVYAEDHLRNNEVDYYIFGHRHLPISHELTNKKSRYINLGEWLTFRSYAVLEDDILALKFFENPDGKIFG